MHHEPPTIATVPSSGHEAVPVRLDGIDALRGFAALAVCLFHWEHIGFGTPVNAQIFRFGLLGVELFFVISGFVIGLVAERSWSLPHFLLARAVRLYPAYLASVALTALYVLSVGKYGIGTVLVNVTMLQSFVAVPNITNPYWTLAFEITFYSLMAGLLAAGALARIESYALAWLALALAYRLIVPGTLGFDDAHPLMQLGYIVVAPQFAPFFVIGAMMYRLHRGRLCATGRVALAAAFGLTLFGRGDFAHVPGPIYAGVTLAMAAALWGAARQSKTGPVLRAFAGLGLVSYPLYLVHCTVAHLCIVLLAPLGLSSAVAVAVSAPVSLALAVLLHQGLERPTDAAFRNNRRGGRRVAVALRPSCP